MKFRVRAAVIALILGIAAISTAAHGESVGIATNTPGNMYHSSGTALAKILNERVGINATVQPFASPTVFIPAVNSGELQFGFGNVFEAALAFEGKEHFSGRATKELRAVAITYPIRNGIYVKKDSPFRKIADLKGHPVPDGFTAQKTFLPLIDAMYATAGLTRADFKPVNVPTNLLGAEAFAAGKADMFSFAVGAAKVREIDATVGVRAISIDNTPANLAAIQKFFPVAYLRLQNPGPDAPGITEPVYLIAYDGLLFTNAKVSDDIVYKVTKAMYEYKPEMASIFSMYNMMDQKDMAKNIPIPYHPGAIKFYKEKGLWPPK